MIDAFFCTHCLEVTEAEDYPTACAHCHVGFCVACGARLKDAAKWCCGCGAIPAVVRAIMYRTSSTAGAYAERDWRWQGLTPYAYVSRHRLLVVLRSLATLPGEQFDEIRAVLEDEQPVYMYGVHSGLESAAEWLSREVWSGPMRGERVRDLTDAERTLLFGRTETPPRDEFP